jgi:DNA-binding CsgD family transcriptional regulator
MSGGLDTRDATALAEAIHDVYSAERAEDFPALAMTVARRVVRCDLTSFNDVDPTRGVVIAEYDPPQWPMFAGAFETFGRLQHEHPVIRYIIESGDGSAKKISDFVPLDDFVESAIYTEFYAKVGIAFQMSITLPAALPRIVGLAMNRERAQPDFDERDRTLLNLLRPHLAQGYEHVRTRDRLARHADALIALAGERGEHVIALESTPAEVTPGAFTVVDRYFGRGGAHRLPRELEDWLGEQRAGVDRADPDVATPAFRALTVAGPDGRLVVRFVPGCGSCDVVVLTERPLDQRTNMQRLGLSRREAEIVHLLATGASNGDIADRLFISSGTVKKHLDNIYRKLGVANRLQAVSVAFELLAVADEPDE